MQDITPKATVLRAAMQSHRLAAPAGNGMLTVVEACEFLRISKWTLYRLIQANQLRTVKIGSRRLVRRQSLAEFIDRLEADGA